MRYEIFENKLYLIEGIEELKKYFPKIPSEKIDELVKLDPTYNPEKNSVGVYGRWIVQMYWNSITNADTLEKYNKFIAMYPDRKHPKTGQEILPPKIKPEIKDEDLYKVPGLLSNYIKYKSKLKKINDYNSLGELSADISPLLSRGITASKAAEQSLTVIKEAIVDGFNVIFNDNKWLIGIPETYSSSAHFQEPITDWCTAYPKMYRYYMENYGGKYFILMNKKTGDLYQFHFESNQFKDRNDKDVGLNGFLSYNPDVRKFFASYAAKNNVPSIMFNAEINPEGKYSQKILDSLALYLNENENYNARLPAKISGNEKFWQDLFKIYITKYSSTLNNFKTFMEKYIRGDTNQSRFIGKAFNIINNLIKQERDNLLFYYPASFSYIKTYYDSDIEDLYKFISSESFSGGEKVRQALKKDNIKKFNENNIKTLKEIIEKTSQQHPSESFIITNGVIELLDKDYLVDVMVNWNNPIYVFDTLYRRVGITEDSKELKDLIKLLNSAFERASDMKLFDNLVEASVGIDDQSIKILVNKLSDKAYDEFLKLFNIKNNNIHSNSLYLLLKRANKETQKMLFNKNVAYLSFVDNIDPSIQIQMIKKNKFNIRYIKNLNKQIKDTILKVYPELKDFIRGI